MVKIGCDRTLVILGLKILLPLFGVRSAMLEFFCKLFWIKCINADGAKIAVLGECGDNRDTILQQLEVGGLFADQSFRARRSLIDYVIDVRRILVFRKLSVFSRCKVEPQICCHMAILCVYGSPVGWP